MKVPKIKPGKHSTISFPVPFVIRLVKKPIAPKIIDGRIVPTIISVKMIVKAMEKSSVANVMKNERMPIINV